MIKIYITVASLATLIIFLIIVGDTSLEGLICDEYSLRDPSHSIVIGDCSVPPGEPTVSKLGTKTDFGTVRSYASCIVQVC